jgi:hypothetical protein
MKVYKGIVKGNTVILEEKPDLPDECRSIRRGTKRALGGILNFSGRLLVWANCFTRSARNFMNGETRLIDTNVLVQAYTVLEVRKGRRARRYHGKEQNQDEARGVH